MEKYLFWGTFFFAYLINGITGFAGNIFAMPVGMVTTGHEESIVVLNCTGFLAGVLIAFTGIKHVVWKELAKMCVIMAIFMAIGAWINTIAPLSILSRYTALRFWSLLSAVCSLTRKIMLLPDWLLYCILAIAGLIQGMFVSGGSFLAIYALQKIRDKEAFRATTTMTWVFLNGAYALYGIQGGSLGGDGLLTLAVCIPLLILSTWLGGLIQKRISQEQFVKFTYVLLTVIGCVLLIK